LFRDPNTNGGVGYAAVFVGRATLVGRFTCSSARNIIERVSDLSGIPHVAGFDDSHSPNSGVVTFDFQGETHSIDFLAQMAGFKPLELPAVLKCPLTVPLCNISTAPLSVMHPMHCLQAQLENIYGATLNRRASAYGERYVSRVRLAMEARRATNVRSGDFTCYPERLTLGSSIMLDLQICGTVATETKPVTRS
jgi:hypothetical protein